MLLAGTMSARTRRTEPQVSQSKKMSLPGSFMLVMAGAAVLVLMGTMMMHTIEIYGGKTFAEAEQDEVIEAHTPLPAGPRRFQ